MTNNDPGTVPPRGAPATAAPAGTAPAATPGRGWALGVGLVVGVLAAVLWSYELVDDTIGGTVADTLLGYDAEDATISGAGAGALFAFVAGMAGTFTACNIAAFSAIAPMVGRGYSVRRQLAAALVPLGWLAVGMLAVSGAYGAVGAVLGDTLPQLSSATTSTGMPVRLVQSTVVFAAIGIALAYLGLAAVGVVPDALARIRARFAHVDVLVVGALIGAFLIGRPFGLFFKMFAYAAERADPLYGAGTFMLQSTGNIVFLVVLFVAAMAVTRGRLPGWLAASPGRLARVTGGAFMAAGAFTFVYWTLRVPAMFGYGWFPTMPWS